MAEERCDLTDLFVSSCAHCTGAKLGDEPDTLRPDIIVARFESRCPSCSETIHPGQFLIRSADSQFFTHEECR